MSAQKRRGYRWVCLEREEEEKITGTHFRMEFASVPFQAHGNNTAALTGEDWLTTFFM